MEGGLKMKKNDPDIIDSGTEEHDFIKYHPKSTEHLECYKKGSVQWFREFLEKQISVWEKRREANLKNTSTFEVMEALGNKIDGRLEVLNEVKLEFDKTFGGKK